MTWRDNLRVASFRGVSFQVEASDFEGGRRGELHEYPLRDDAYFEDLGRRARRFTIDGFVIGAEYMNARDALIEALERGGVGQLVHPFYGSRNVSCPEFRVSESGREGGLARFQLTFVESGEPAQPFASSDKSAQVIFAADEFGSAIEEAFVETFVAYRVPGFVLDSSLSMVVSALNSLSPGITDSGLAERVSTMTENALAAIVDLAPFAKEVVSIVRDFPISSGSVTPILSNLMSFSEADFLEVMPVDTFSRVQEVANATLMGALIRRAALSATASVLTGTSFGSAQEANTAMVDFADLVDSEVERLGLSDSEFFSARLLKAKVVADLSSRLGGLPRVRSIQTPSASPALVIAYDLYGDIGRDQEIILRNAILRPGFTSGGNAVEVLSE